MIRRSIAAAILATLVAAAPAEAGFWGDLKRSFGTAVDSAGHDGAKAADAVGEVAGDAADAVIDGAESVAGLVAGEPESADQQAIDNTTEPATDGSKQLAIQSKK